MSKERFRLAATRTVLPHAREPGELPDANAGAPYLDVEAESDLDAALCGVLESIVHHMHVPRFESELDLEPV